MASKTAICFIDAQHCPSRSFFQKTILVESLHPYFEKIEFVFLLASSADEIYIPQGDDRILLTDKRHLHELLAYLKDRSRHADKVLIVENEIVPDSAYCAQLAESKNSHAWLPEKILVLMKNRQIHQYDQLDRVDSLDWRCPFFLCLGFSPNLLPDRTDRFQKSVVHCLRESLFQVFLQMNIELKIGSGTTAFAQEQSTSFGDIWGPSWEMSFFSEAQPGRDVFQPAVSVLDKLKASYQRPQILETESLYQNVSLHASRDARWRRLPHSKPLFFKMTAPYYPEVDLYRKYCQLLQGSDYVVVLHQFRRGGAEKEAVMHLKAYCDLNPNRKVSLILTLPVEPDLEWQLPPQVQICEFGREAATLLGTAEQIYLLYRVLDQIAPQIIHVKCSYQGWQIFARYGRQLSLKSRLWVSLYCIDYQRTGAATSFAFHELLAAAPYLEYLLADNQGLLEDLQRTVAVKNIQKIFYPVEATPTLWEKSDVGSKALRVLWCSRLSFQKDINTLLRIAFLLPHVQFHVFGELSENTNHAQVLANFKNVKIWGIFDGVGDIPLNEYDVFLYTSFWDGLPNILLEIGIRGMPVISPKVGGITEILNGQNSYLYGNLRELKSILESWPKERNQGKARALLLRKDIETHHNWDQFMQKCQELYGH